jgi:hypothetical protein
MSHLLLALHLDIFGFSINWNNWPIVANMSTNTVPMALAMSCDSFWGRDRPPSRPGGHYLRDLDDWHPDEFYRYVNTISELLEEVTCQLAVCNSQTGRERLFAIKSFLWVSWQRSTMLLFW